MTFVALPFVSQRVNENDNILARIVNVCFCFHQAPSWKIDIFQGPLGTMDCMGKSPPTVGGSHGHKQRRVGDYLLFKQIAGSVWPRLQRPLNFAPLQMFKSPREGIGVLLRNKQLLGQNSLWIPGWTASGVVGSFADWLADMQNILLGADAWVVQEIARLLRN